MDVQKAKEKTRENHAKIFAGLSQLSILKFYLNITVIRLLRINHRIILRRNCRSFFEDLLKAVCHFYGCTFNSSSVRQHVFCNVLSDINIIFKTDTTPVVSSFVSSLVPAVPSGVLYLI